VATAGQAVPGHPGLEELPIPAEWADDDIPHGVDALIADAEDGAWALEQGAGGGRFVASDYRWAWQVLRRWRAEGAVAAGARFLEWGSGQGTVTLLAALLGMRAEGVDRDARLVEAARALAERHGVPGARFRRASYAALPGDRLPVADATGRDVVYVYPWPGEEEFFLALFEAGAAPGARLLMALGPLEARAFRKKG